MSSILVVDDDKPLARALEINLKAHGYAVNVAHDARSALDLFAHTHPALVILDLGLPDMDGIDVLHGIRGFNSTPVIVLSARSTSAEKVDALDAGADDYVTKPFAMDELLARIRVAVRRVAPVGGSELGVVSTADFTVDVPAHKIFRDGEPVRLTPTEWAMLEILLHNSGKLVSGAVLLREVWGPAYADQSHYLRV